MLPHLILQKTRRLSYPMFSQRGWAGRRASSSLLSQLMKHPSRETAPSGGHPPLPHYFGAGPLNAPDSAGKKRHDSHLILPVVPWSGHAMDVGPTSQVHPSPCPDRCSELLSFSPLDLLVFSFLGQPWHRDIHPVNRSTSSLPSVRD